MMSEEQYGKLHQELAEKCVKYRGFVDSVDVIEMMGTIDCALAGELDSQLDEILAECREMIISLWRQYTKQVDRANSFASLFFGDGNT
jgi:hypothetical protein